jgi:myo-inositol-1(or 4)-monophosphatase
MFEKEFSFAVKTALSAGKILKRYSGSSNRIHFKGAIDIVTDADLASEKFITKKIKKEFPYCSILCEEGSNVNGEGEMKWIVDPLDGTTNFAHNYPFFAVSIALEVKGRIVLGVVYDPLRNELFSALKGKGATLNGRRISVSKINKLQHAMLSTGFPYDVATSPENNLDHWANFIKRVQAIRRDGSAALNISYVACGRFDGFWEMKLKPWDLSAGALIVEEAGGKVTDFSGGEFDHYSGRIVASNGLIHKDMVEVLKEGLKSSP